MALRSTSTTAQPDCAVTLTVAVSPAAATVNCSGAIEKLQPAD
jgi:hypothetical protein